MADTQKKVASALGLSTAEENKIFFGFETYEEIERHYNVDPIDSVRSFQEEYAIPLGRSLCSCITCKLNFYGFKGRLTCKTCNGKEVSNG